MHALARHLARSGRPTRWALLLALAATLLIVNRALLVGARQARDIESVVETAEVLYVPDTRLVRLMTLGYEQAAADVMWVRTLGYFSRHFTRDRRYPWLEYFLDQVIELDPHFDKVYHWAGASVLYGQRFTVENIELSTRFYRRALENNPDDYEAAYRIGLNYYVEMPGALARAGEGEAAADAQREIGLEYLERAANIPAAPERMRQLVASISQRLGKQRLALQYVVDLYLQTTDPERRAALEQRIEALRAAGGDAYAAAAERFDKAWRSSYPYVPPAVYALMGEPSDGRRRDVDWRALLPDVALDSDAADTLENSGDAPPRGATSPIDTAADETAAEDLPRDP